MTIALLSAFVIGATCLACGLAILLKRELQREVSRIFDGFADAVK